jgi:hypothetical protein
MKPIKGFTLLFVLIALLVPHARAAHENSIQSSWLVTPVAVDGDITYSNEWSDANNIDLVMGTNYGRSPPFLETKLWVKNDQTHIFFLVCIKYEYLNYDLRDKAYLYYMIPDESHNIIFSDKTVTGQLGDTYDLFNYDGATWQHDLDGGGENDVQGMGHFDGIFYWFEIKKPLNSQDGLDWDLSYGDTYGYADSPIDTEEHLCLGLHDQSENYDMQAFIQITISSPDTRNIIPVGGTVEEIPEMEIIKPIIIKVLMCSAIIILATILARYIK